MASGNSKETEIKLTNIARASLDELLIDYKDFLRNNNLKFRDKGHLYYSQLTKKHKTLNATYDTYKKGIDRPYPEVSVNVMLSLINVTSYLLAR